MKRKGKENFKCDGRIHNCSNHLTMNDSWRIGSSRYTLHLKKQSQHVSPAVFPLTCLAHGAAVLISLPFSPLLIFSSSTCISPSLSGPLVLWTAAREARGCVVTHWAVLTGEKVERAAEKNALEGGEERGKHDGSILKWEHLTGWRNAAEIYFFVSFCFWTSWDVCSTYECSVSYLQ